MTAAARTSAISAAPEPRATIGPTLRRSTERGFALIGETNLADFFQGAAGILGMVLSTSFDTYPGRGATIIRRYQSFRSSPVTPAMKIALSSHPAMICIHRYERNTEPRTFIVIPARLRLPALLSSGHQ